MAEAPTATGNRKSLVTFRVSPRVATINANSPICAMLIPTCMDCFKGCPDNSAPRVVANILPKIVSRVTQRIAIRCSKIAAGSINIPIDTKNTAPNRSFTGLRICSIFSAEVVSASIDPITNAPSSAEKPISVAKTTIPRQSPIESISNVSSSRIFFARLKKLGSRKMPAMNHTVRKKSSFSTEVIISVPLNCWVTAMVDSNTISKITTISSTINTPNTIPANCCRFTPNSEKALIIMVVDELASSPPRKRLSINDQFIHLPTA